MTDLETLYRNITKQKKVVDIATKKTALAQSVYKEEKKYYNQARSSLNDLIQAINNLEGAKFNQISQEIQLNVLITEWFRLTDSLVTSSDIKN